MRWIEMVQVRTLDSAERTASIVSDYLTKDSGSEPGLVDVKLYKDASGDGDITCLLIWETGCPERQGSRFALSLSRSIKMLGLIKHSIWVEQKIDTMGTEEKDTWPTRAPVSHHVAT